MFLLRLGLVGSQTQEQGFFGTYVCLPQHLVKSCAAAAFSGNSLALAEYRLTGLSPLTGQSFPRSALNHGLKRGLPEENPKVFLWWVLVWLLLSHAVGLRYFQTQKT